MTAAIPRRAASSQLLMTDGQNKPKNTTISATARTVKTLVSSENRSNTTPSARPIALARNVIVGMCQ
jgi:hypothetical protein